MREFALYQVDAFTERRFGGNPAGVVPLERWLPDAVMQSIAAENNVAETAFFVPEGDRYGLRWFTPAVEVDLCGHATLASGFVIANFLTPGKTAMRFGTRSGELSVHRDGDVFTLDFPILATKAVDDPPDMTRALGKRPAAVHAGKHWLAIFDRESDLRDLVPDMPEIMALGRDGVIVTAPGSDRDYVCRYFVPQAGIPEDPATGSAQCTLMPYWAARLGRAKLTGRQISARIGEFRCELKGDRVAISGQAVCYLKGSIFVE